VARATRDGRAKTSGATRLTRAVVPLLAALGLACASQQDPPGGPPDFTPPVLLTATPDSGSVLTDLDRHVRFEFNEIIAERGLADLVTVSPRHERVSVRWNRDGVTIRPSGGWRQDVVYVVRLAPGLLDLRNNRLMTGVTTVFSTGGGFPAGLVHGTMIDWEAGRRAVGGLIEAIRPADSLTYVAQSDSSGAFSLPFLSAGDWVVVATVDLDRNGQRGRREGFDSTIVTVGPTDTVAVVLWTFVHDSAGPTLRDAQRTDSVTVRLAFGGKLDPTAPTAAGVQAFLLPDSLALGVEEVLSEAAWNALRTVRADTLPADTLPADILAIGRPATPDSVAPAAAPAVDELLLSRPSLPNTWYVRLAEPLRPGSRYLFLATASNPGGAISTTRAVLVIPDTTASDR